MAVCATSVPKAEPAIPKSRTVTSTRLRTTFAPNPMTETTNGVRVSNSPRRTPVTASEASMAGNPNAAIRKYVAAWSRTASLAPKAPASGYAAPATIAATTTPMARDSHSPSSPAAKAPRVEPAPSCRATEAVVA